MDHTFRTKAVLTSQYTFFNKSGMEVDGVFLYMVHFFPWLSNILYIHPKQNMSFLLWNYSADIFKTTLCASYSVYLLRLFSVPITLPLKYLRFSGGKLSNDGFPGLSVWKSVLSFTWDFIFLLIDMKNLFKIDIFSYLYSFWRRAVVISLWPIC